MPACLTAQPVTDRGQPGIIGKQVQPDRSQAIAACRVRDHERRAASLGPAAVGVLDEGAGIRLRVRVRERWDVPAQFAVAARRGDPGNVAGHRAAKDDPLGGQRRVAEGESHNQQNTGRTAPTSCSSPRCGVVRDRPREDVGPACADRDDCAPSC
jgi:hypothetical protein